MLGNWKLAIGGFLFILVCFWGTVSAQKIKESSEETQKNPVESSDAKPASNDVSPASEENGASSAKNKKDSYPRESYKLRRGEKEWIYEAGSSPFNPSNFTGPKEYDVYGRDLHLTNFRWGRVIGTKGFITYQYLFGATPLTLFTKNEITNPEYISPKKTPTIPPTMRQMSWGFAVQPLNFRFIFFPKSRIKPFAQIGAGILLTSRSMPVPRSTPFNFTGDFGGGIQYFTSRRKAINFSYRYFHISNGNIGGRINNPGYNANVFSVSYSFFHK